LAGVAVLAAVASKSEGDHQESKNDNDDPSSPAASATVTPTPTATTSASEAANEANEGAQGQKLLLSRLCGEFATAKAAGKTLNPGLLGVLTKAAGTAAAIPAFCAALPALPAACVSVSPTATPTATATAKPNDGDDGDGDDSMKHAGPFCGICPQAKATATPTATPTVSPTPTTTAIRHGEGWAFGLWCGGLGEDHHVDPKVIPLPTVAAGLDSHHDGGDQGHGQANGQGNDHH
jgi:hypothetical protein